MIRIVQGRGLRLWPDATVSGVAPAPSTQNFPQSFSVTGSAAANILTSAGVTVVVSPSSTTVQYGQTQQFTATVYGTPNQGVTWAATDGTITSGGLYTAPSVTETVTVTATSIADPTKSATATASIVPPQSGQWPRILVFADPFDANPYLLRLNQRGFRFANVDLWALHKEYYDFPQVFARAGVSDTNVPLALKSANPNAQFTVYNAPQPYAQAFIDANPQVWFTNTSGTPFLNVNSPTQTGQRYPNWNHPDFITFETNFLKSYVQNGGALGSVKPLNGIHNDDAGFWSSELAGYTPNATTQDLRNAQSNKRSGFRAVAQNLQAVSAQPWHFGVESEGQNWADFNVNQPDADSYWTVFTMEETPYFYGFLAGAHANYVKASMDRVHALGAHWAVFDDSSDPDNLNMYAYCFYLCFSDGVDLFFSEQLPSQAMVTPGDPSSPVFRLQPQGPAVNTSGNIWQRTFDRAIVTCNLDTVSWSFVRR